MKLTKVLTLCVICLLVGNMVVTAYASENTSLMDDRLKADVNESMEFGDTVCLANILEFSLPSDWEEVPEEELDEKLSFQCNRTDADGRKTMFVGLVHRYCAELCGRNNKLYGYKGTAYSVQDKILCRANQRN